MALTAMACVTVGGLSPALSGHRAPGPGTGRHIPIRVLRAGPDSKPGLRLRVRPRRPLAAAAAPQSEGSLLRVGPRAGRAGVLFPAAEAAAQAYHLASFSAIMMKLTVQKPQRSKQPLGF